MYAKQALSFLIVHKKALFLPSKIITNIHRDVAAAPQTPQLGGGPS